MKRPKQPNDSLDKGSYFDSYTKQQSNNQFDSFDSNVFNIWSYLRVEMFGIGEPGTLEPPNQEHIENFFLVPLHLESLIFLGFFICVDAFLYVITYLPIRVAFSLILLVQSVYNHIHTSYLSVVFPFIFPPTKAAIQLPNALRFHRTQTYDIMRGAMFFVGCVALRQINMSQVYHFIRGQSMIKLYVLTSMLEIFDKLLSSFGQDAFDALHWHTRCNPRSLKLLLTFVMVTTYVSLHALVYFLHVATLTVVINSVDSALITVLILNNFAELKTFILKKFDCNNLFQLACSDITERFQTFLFLSLILMVSVAQAGAVTWDILYSFLRIAVMMLLGECCADWFKHAFINKFNLINASVYQDFAYVLRNDILSNQKDEVILDHTYSVTRRLGLSQIPLGCVCVRYMNLAITTPAVQLFIQEASSLHLATIAVSIFASLLLCKVAIGVGLVFYSAGAHKRDAAVFHRTPAVVASAKHSDHGTGAIHHNSSSSSHPHPGGSLMRQGSNSSHGDTQRSVTVGIAEVPSPVVEEEDATSLPESVQSVPRLAPRAAIEPTAVVTQSRSRSNSIPNPFTDILHATTNSFDSDKTIEKEAGAAEHNHNSVQTGNGASNDGEIVGTENGMSGKAAQRPPLGRLNLGTLQMSNSNTVTSPISNSGSDHERNKAFFDGSISNCNADRGLVTPPLSPQPRSGSHVADYPHQHSPCTTSTPIVQLDASAFVPHVPADAIAHTTECCDNDDIRSVLSETSKHTATLEELDAQRMRERLEFMEELSSIERYTVYKGRIL